MATHNHDFRVNLAQINYLNQKYVKPQYLKAPFRYNHNDDVLGVIKTKDYAYHLKFELDVINENQFSYYLTVTKFNLAGQPLNRPKTYNNDNLAPLYQIIQTII